MPFSLIVEDTARDNTFEAKSFFTNEILTILHVLQVYHSCSA